MRQVQQDPQTALALVTRRRAFRGWQTLEAGLETIRQEVERLYLMALQTTPESDPAGPPPLLRTASAFIGQPLDSVTLRLRQRLIYAFGLFGTSLWRRPPLSLRLDILEYADRIAVISRRGRKLNRQLQLALEIIRFLNRRPPGRDSHPSRAALTDPESMRLILLLEERRALTRGINETALRQSCQVRIAACLGWLALLQPHLSDQEFTQLQATLTAATAHLDNPSDQSFSHLSAAHQQLDHFTQQVHFGNTPDPAPTF